MTHTFIVETQQEEGADFESVRSDVQTVVNELTERVLSELMFNQNDVCSGQDYFGPVLMIYTALSMTKGMWHVGIPKPGQFMEPLVNVIDAIDLVAALYLHQDTAVDEDQPRQLELMEVAS